MNRQVKQKTHNSCKRDTCPFQTDIMLRFLRFILPFLLFPCPGSAQIYGTYEKTEEGLITKLMLNDTSFTYLETVPAGHGGFMSSGRIGIGKDTLFLFHEPYVFPKPGLCILKSSKPHESIKIAVCSKDTMPLANSDIYLLKNDEVVYHLKSDLEGRQEIPSRTKNFDKIIIDHLHANQPLTLLKTQIPSHTCKIQVYLPLEHANSYNTLYKVEKYLIKDTKLIPVSREKPLQKIK